jgi:TorA maturation chaperone TorD
MASPGAQTSAGIPAAPEETLRAALYRLLASSLSSPPTAETIELAENLTGDVTPLGRAVSALARAAGRADLARLGQEYHDLFIGLGRGELVPYGSYYLTGFLQEKPLAALRQDMARLQIARSSDTHDPEDHAASVLEMMAGLIDGAFGAPQPVAEQKRFYQSHVGSWLPVFFRDLESVQSSAYFAALGGVGRAFLEIEDAAFELE